MLATRQGRELRGFRAIYGIVIHVLPSSGEER